ncbi:Response regulator receiver domain-containing protein [Salinimicrobium catena]|uniref:Response regulator receiver domain-containing protein n=1 Tax=Salinimicrobium catena TaxID=390640 RepID=A0A1H5LMH3_9FLAO|nr:response regulator [Salinimicrobium catena]SDL11707.1 Response regulator receiver domain-containing protein [Salinimicrobium catena]SEE78200.1 Response regulator receiver domain-containing protein [Salinimicrobium catena]
MNKILLVEDDFNLGDILKDQLEMNGYDVKLLRVPAQTVETLQAEKFDLVILDKLLSGTDGTEVCNMIRETEGVSQTPILMMSGFDGAQEVCISAGANNFIAKPFSVDDFLQSIEATINKKEA